MTTVNEVGESPRSPTASLFAATVPSVPTGLTITRTEYNPPLIAIAWTGSADQGSAVYNYEIGVSLHNVDNPAVVTVGGSKQVPWTLLPAPVFTITQVSVSPALITNTQYKIKVRGVNQMGSSAWTAYTSTANGYGYSLSKMDVPVAFGRHNDVVLRQLVFEE